MFSLQSHEVGTELRFDPRKHLQIEMPRTVKTLQFDDIPFPYRAEDIDGIPPGEHLAYTAPFRLLSEEGTRELRAIVDKNTAHIVQNDRNCCIRGLGYLSQWVRDLSYSDEVVGMCSALANEPLWPHDVLMHMGHTNFGAIDTGRAVDEWHTDSGE
jgi:hypothetical protein